MLLRPWLALLLVVWSAAPAAAVTYYVSPSGSNANAGTSPTEAWLGIDRVNAHDFDPGDEVRFEAGKTFAGNLYFDAADAGTAASPVVVGSYGTGRATIYPGNGRGILVYNAGGFEISNLYVVGSGRDINTESGILILNDLPGDVLLDHILIEYVDAVRFGDYGIEIAGTNGRSGFRDVSIQFVIASENGSGGIFTHAARRATHQNVYIANSSAFLNLGFRGRLFNSGNGITMAGVNGGTIERSVAHTNGERCDAGNGPIGIWSYDSNDVTIQFNESFNNRTGGTKDGGGFSLDNSTSNATVQYNYSHDNAGAGFLLAHKWNDFVHSGNVIRWNISQNDARKNNYAAIHLWGRIRNAEIYNNTVYMTYPGGAARALHARNNSIELQDLENVSIYNNIFQTVGGVPLIDFTRAVLDAAVNVRIENNLYWSTGGAFRIMWAGVTYTSLAAWQAATRQEMINGGSAAIVADPQLEAPGTGPAFNNAFLIGGLWQYRLRPTSPAIDSGMDLVARGIDPGPRDFFGGASRRYLAPDRGAHEFHVDCSLTLTPDAATVPAEGGGANIDVWAAADDCTWAAMPAAPWLFVSAESGAGPGTVGWWSSANPGASRIGRIAIGNKTFTVTQQGSVESPPPPAGWVSGDIGAVGLAGSAAANADGSFTLRGAGADVWGTADAFHFGWQQVDGDWEIDARVRSVENINAWTKAGVMIRATTAAGSQHAAMMVTPGKGLALQYRTAAGGLTTNVSGGAGTAPYWVRLTRQGSTITAYKRLTDSGAWTKVGTATIAMPSTILIGLFISSHDAARLATAEFDNVGIRSINVAPPPPPPPPPPPGNAGEDIVLWASEASPAPGWTVTADTTAAGGKRLQNANAGVAKIVTPSASPTQYFEMTFNAIAGRAYRLWMRGKAISNAAVNDSVHVQFDKSVDASGNAIYRIGGTTGAEMNLEDCSGCGLAGWGWQDNGWGVGVMGPLIYFASTGSQTIRVQVREDGLGIDQIVLSSVKWVTQSPGTLKNDTVILAKQP